MHAKKRYSLSDHTRKMRRQARQAFKEEKEQKLIALHRQRVASSSSQRDAIVAAKEAMLAHRVQADAQVNDFQKRRQWAIDRVRTAPKRHSADAAAAAMCGATLGLRMAEESMQACKDAKKRIRERKAEERAAAQRAAKEQRRIAEVKRQEELARLKAEQEEAKRQAIEKAKAERARRRAEMWGGDLVFDPETAPENFSEYSTSIDKHRRRGSS